LKLGLVGLFLGWNLARFDSFLLVFGSFWVCFFCVFLVKSHCNSLSYQEIRVVRSSGNWVCLAYNQKSDDRCQKSDYRLSAGDPPVADKPDYQ
jgi:hypothetical protein